MWPVCNGTIFSRFVFAGVKDLHAHDLKRHEKLETPVLGGNLDPGLAASIGCTLHQEIIMAGAGKRFTFTRVRQSSLLSRPDRHR